MIDVGKFAIADDDPSGITGHEIALQLSLMSLRISQVPAWRNAELPDREKISFHLEEAKKHFHKIADIINGLRKVA